MNQYIPLVVNKAVFSRAVYWANFFDTIRYNTFSCNVRYIGWTICLNIFGEKDKKSHSAASYSFLAEYSQNLFARGHFWILNFEPDEYYLSTIFKPDDILAYRQNNVSYIASQTYTGTYRYIWHIDSPLVFRATLISSTQI